MQTKSSTSANTNTNANTSDSKSNPGRQRFVSAPTNHPDKVFIQCCFVHLTCAHTVNSCSNYLQFKADRFASWMHVPSPNRSYTSDTQGRVDPTQRRWTKPNLGEDFDVEEQDTFADMPALERV